MQTVDAGLQQVFEQCGLGAVCLDVCRELGVTCLYDLENHVTEQNVDDLPKYVKPAQKSKLKTLIAGQLPAAGGFKRQKLERPSCRPGRRKKTESRPRRRRRPKR